MGGIFINTGFVERLTFWQQVCSCRSSREKKPYSDNSFSFLFVWMAGYARTFPCTPCLQRYSYGPDDWAVINNVFPLWAIKYFHRDSLDSSAELKGASTVVVAGPWIFGAHSLPPRLKQRRVATHCWIMLSLWPVMSGDRKCFLLCKVE